MLLLSSLRTPAGRLAFLTSLTPPALNRFTTQPPPWRRRPPLPHRYLTLQNHLTITRLVESYETYLSTDAEAEAQKNV